MSMFTDWLEWAIHPFSHEKAHLQSATNPEYEALLAYFRSGQMNAAQLQAQMDDDPDFEMFVLARIGQDEKSAENSERALVHH